MSSGEWYEEVGRECRICHTKSSAGLVQSPCHCKGSMGHVHVQCLEKWLRISSNSSCELCAYTFQVVRVRSYSLLQSVRVWVLKDRTRIARGSLILLLLLINPAAACWLWVLWVSEIPRVFFSKSDKPDEVLTGGVDEEVITVTKWVIIFAILTTMAAVSILSLYFDAYRNILRRFYRAWKRVRNETAAVRVVLGLESEVGNRETNEENGCLNIAVDKENKYKDEGLQEIKISSNTEENK